MSLSLIKGALETQVASISPTISTEYENVLFTPVAGTPYQSMYFMPAINERRHLNDAAYTAKGIFQITLFYPLNQGTSAVMTRAQLYVDNFPIGLILVNSTTKVIISDTPDVVRLGVVGDRYQVVISVSWKAYF